MLYLNGYPVRDFRFPDNTIRLFPEDCDLLNHYRDESVVLAAYEDSCYEIIWKYEDPAEQVILYSLVSHLRDRFAAQEINLIMPYIPNARMDRTHNCGEVHMLKYFCRFINDLHFNSVQVMDPHSDVSVSLLDRVFFINPTPFVKHACHYSGAQYLFFPDEGAAKRYGPVYNFRPYLHGKKVHDWATGTISGLKVENPMELKDDFNGKSILIIDDICSRGGTFMYAGLALKKMGFGKIDLCITHCEKTIFAGKLLSSDSPINHIYTTDSIFTGEHDKISVMELDLC